MKSVVIDEPGKVRLNKLSEPRIKAMKYCWNIIISLCETISALTEAISIRYFSKNSSDKMQIIIGIFFTSSAALPQVVFMFLIKK